MKPNLLDYLACPDCSGRLQLLSVKSYEQQEIIEGELGCASCARRYPIVRGVPRFVDRRALGRDEAATAANFAWQWQHFAEMNEHYAVQFLSWIAPVKPDFFAGKLVLEAGCGKGRHTRLAAAWGAREVIGIDLSDAVETAFVATREMENAHIVQADIYHLPLRRVFDYAFAIGVLHHLPDPRAGFFSLASRVKPGGHLTVWVYSAENNDWVMRWISPLRKHVTSRISPRALLHLSKLPTAVLYAATKLVYGPLSRLKRGAALAQRLFYHDYLTAIADFTWREQHLIVFDHLVAPTAFYISRSEFEQWWRALGISDLVIRWHNKNSWLGFGRISAAD